MCAKPGDPIDNLLERIAAGGPDAPAARETLANLIYEDLKTLAHRVLARKWHRASLSTTLMTHEVWLRVIQHGTPNFKNRNHLFGAFARAAIRIIVENGRRKHIKLANVDPDEQSDSDPDPLVQFIKGEISEKFATVLQEFAIAHALEFEIFALNVVLGFTQKEIAEQLDLPVWTVQAKLAFARADLKVRLRRKIDI